MKTAEEMLEEFKEKEIGAVVKWVKVLELMKAYHAQFQLQPELLVEALRDNPAMDAVILIKNILHDDVREILGPLIDDAINKALKYAK